MHFAHFDAISWLFAENPELANPVKPTAVVMNTLPKYFLSNGMNPAPIRNPVGTIRAVK